MYKLLLPLRYFLKRRITWLAVISIALCVFVSLVVMTVLSGLAVQFKLKNHRFAGDAVMASRTVLGFDGYEEFTAMLQQEGFVESVSPVVRNYVLANFTYAGYPVEERTLELIGFDPVLHGRTTGLASTLHFNSEPANAFRVSSEPSQPGCMVSIGLLNSRDARGNYTVSSAVPDWRVEVTAIPLTAKGAPARAATDIVSSKTYRLSDYVNTGIAALDYSTIYLPLEEAQMLCGMNLSPRRVSSLHIKFAPGVDVDAGTAKVAALWQQYLSGMEEPSDLMKQVRVQPWWLHQREMIAAVDTEQRMMTMIFGLLGIIAVFIVFVVFYMIISHKTKDIGIMKSIGASTGDITGLFLCFGLVIGVTGAVTGALAGIGFLSYVNTIEAWLFGKFQFQLWDRSIYAIGEIPNDISGTLLGGIAASAIFASLAGALVPSLKAALRNPVESLQVNKL